MGLFVAGTDTGVGKTVVTAGITAWLRSQGVGARAVKPCQTGCPPDDDAGFVAAACGNDDAAVCLERLEPPLAPEVAAVERGASLSYDAIRAGCEAVIANCDVAIVEGIGGVRVPLADGREVLDLAADLGLTAIVVARSGLGTLNHTALTVGALRERDVPVRGVVLNRYADESLAERTNPAVLERMLDVDVTTLPNVDLAEPVDAVEAVREHLPASWAPGI